MKLLITICFFFCVHFSLCQTFAINTDGSNADASALLDVKANNKGVLIPRLTKTQKNNIVNPATGLLVFQTLPDSIGFHYYNSTAWLWLDPNYTSAWKTTGNAGTDTAVNFFGTTDAMPLRFKQNNITIANWNRNKRSYFIGVGAGNVNSIANGQISIGDSTGTNFTGTAAPGVLIGSFAGKNLTSGFNPIMIGLRAGENSTTGGANVFVGSLAGRFNTTGAVNTYFGHQSGDSASTGNFNTSIGASALSRNKKGNNNSAIGYDANVASDSLVNATAIGSLAFIDTSNALVLGSISGINNATANTNVSIGTTKPKAALHINRGNAGFTATIPTNRNLLIEDNANSYLQMLTPDLNESGIFAGNASNIVKAGVVFAADSSLQLKAGGSNTGLILNKAGLVGVGTLLPKAKLHITSAGNLANAKYITSPLAVFEYGNTFGNTAIQLMSNSNSDFSIYSSTDSTFNRSNITFNNDSSITFGTGTSSNRLRINNQGFVGIGIFTPEPLAKLDVNGTFKLGANGSVNTALIKDTVNIDVVSIAANSFQDVTVTLAGATVNGAVSVSPAADIPSGVIIAWARVSAANTIKIRFNNVTSSAINPAAINYFVSVVQ